MSKMIVYIEGSG